MSSLPSPISIEDFTRKIGLNTNNQIILSDWWNENRDNIVIYYFPFKVKELLGCLIGKNEVAMNQIESYIPNEYKIFVLLHESFHSDQHLSDEFSYFNSIKENNKELFISIYKKMETDANDYAIQHMNELGFESFINMMKIRLKSNENAGNEMWGIIKNDFEKYKPTDIFDLIKKQIM